MDTRKLSEMGLNGDRNSSSWDGSITRDCSDKGIVNFHSSSRLGIENQEESHQ